MVKDISGETFGRLTVVKRVENDKHNKARWLCRCSCGNEKIVVGSNLLSGRTSSCGCLISEDLSGKRFGRLTVLRRCNEEVNHSYGHSVWICVCNCGKETVVYGSSLLQGRTKSCGCYQAETARQANSTHGQSNTRLHRIWAGMKERCCNINAANYKNYGGRGISVCEEWMRDFVAFRDWAVTHGYSDDLSIDRIDVNGNYDPENCRWATAKEQNNNKRNNRLLH